MARTKPEPKPAPEKPRATLALHAVFDLEAGIEVSEIHTCIRDAIEIICGVGAVTSCKLKVPAHEADFTEL